jgi:hypothetical protein
MDKKLIDSLPLIQQYFGIKESKSVMNLLGNDYWEDINDDLSRNEFLIYLDLPKPKVLLRIKGGKSLAERAAKLPNVKEVLMHLPEINYDSILFILTLFGFFGDLDPLQKIKDGNRFESIGSLDDILKPTFGYLFYAHQFEQIYSHIPSVNQKEVVSLRKDWNKKNSEAIELVKQTEIKPGYSFYDLLMDRTVEENHFVWNANFKGANHLWNYINKIQSEKKAK